MRLDFREGELRCPYCSTRWQVDDRTTLGEIAAKVREHNEREHR